MFLSLLFPSLTLTRFFLLSLSLYLSILLTLVETTPTITARKHVLLCTLAVHHLLYKSGLVEQWVNRGKSHVVFLQDTNALVVNSILPTLGVSVKNGFVMNSICIPRIAGEAAGAITRLEYVYL